MVSHASLLTAVQLQPEPAVTLILPLAPMEEARVLDVGEMVTAHGSPDCVTVNVWPPIVTVPVRDVAPLLAATL